MSARIFVIADEPDVRRDSPMMNDDEPCPVCRGRRVITLPLYQRLAVPDWRSPPEPVGPVTITSGNFACPQCSATKVREVFTLEARTTYDSRLNHSDGFFDHVRGVLAHRLADEILQRGFIAFSISDEDINNGTREMKGRIGVISKTELTTMDERVERQASRFLDELIRRTEVQVSNWGSASAYVDHRIEKSRAIEFMRQERAAMAKSMRQRKP